MEKTSQKTAFWVSARLVLGFIFFWAFLDKLLGLGFSTKPVNAWIAGGSPTTGFLSNATHGPLANVYHQLAGQPLVDLLFMFGLASIGLALLLGVGLRMAGYAGTLMMLLMWSSMLPPENNPLFDEHIIYSILFLGLAHSEAGNTWGLGKAWRQTKLVKAHPWLA